MQQPITDTELAAAESYLQSVRRWGTEVGPGDPEVQARIAQAGFYRAAVQEAYGRIQVTNAIRDNRPELVGAFLRRNFDREAVASALNWGGSGINRMVNGMDVSSRRAMAEVLAQSPRMSSINTLSVSQLRATLPSPADRMAFDQRYPARQDLLGATVMV